MTQWSFINNTLQSQNSSRAAKGSSSLDRLYSRKLRKQLVHHKQVNMFSSRAEQCEELHSNAFCRRSLILPVLLQQLNLLKAKQKALFEQIEKEKIQSNKGSSYKLLVEQAKLKQATSKVRSGPEAPSFQLLLPRLQPSVRFPPQHFKDLIRLRRTAEWPRSTLDAESTAAKDAPEVEPLPFTLSHERCISVVQKLALFLLSMDFTCHADLLLFVCKVTSDLLREGPRLM